MNDWPVVAACITLLPASLTAAWIGARMHARDIAAGITEEV